MIDGGPGGISAARLLESYNASVHLLERGPDLPSGFYEQLITKTYLDSLPSTRTCQPLGDGTTPTIACQYSGNLGANGKIYARGTSEDLAKSAGVSVKNAATAQSLAASYVEVDEGLYMWKCVNASACDRSFTTSSNTEVYRRSVAFKDGAPWKPARVTFDTTVRYVSKDLIRFWNGSAIHLKPGDKIIVAAGALTTPQLLNQTTWTGWNHYYKVTPLWAAVNEQSIAYDPATRVETNIANVMVNGTATAIKIEMLMEHDVVETFDVNQSYTPTGQGDFLLDAWHYGGTVGRLHYEENIFIGDASALATPFNCHTSMPAAAAGVLAGQRALNILAEDTPSSSKVGGLTTVGAWFATGTFLLALAVVAHILGGRAGSRAVNDLLFNLHYALASIAVVIISIGVAVAASQRNAKLQHSDRGGSGGGHYYVGYVTLGWLWLQAIFGAVLNAYPDLKTRAGWTHRIPAVLLFALLLYLLLLLSSMWSVVLWRLSSSSALLVIPKRTSKLMCHEPIN